METSAAGVLAHPGPHRRGEGAAGARALPQPRLGKGKIFQPEGRGVTIHSHSPVTRARPSLPSNSTRQPSGPGCIAWPVNQAGPATACRVHGVWSAEGPERAADPAESARAQGANSPASFCLGQPVRPDAVTRARPPVAGGAPLLFTERQCCHSRPLARRAAAHTGEGREQRVAARRIDAPAVLLPAGSSARRALLLSSPSRANSFEVAA